MSADNVNIEEYVGEVCIYGDLGWDCASFSEDGLKTLVKLLKEKRPGLF